MLRFLMNILFSNSIKSLDKKEPYELVGTSLTGHISASPARCEQFSTTFKREVMEKK